VVYRVVERTRNLWAFNIQGHKEMEQATMVSCLCEVAHDV